MRQSAFASAISGVVLTALSACGSSSPAVESAEEAVAAEPATSGDEGYELSAGEATTPSELRTRLAYPLERPSLARIQPGPMPSWIFAAHPDSLPEESRPVFRYPRADPEPYLSSVTSDPVGRELITTQAEADEDGARLRYTP